MLAIVCICVCEFWDEILLRGKNVKPGKKLNFSEKWQNGDLSI